MKTWTSILAGLLTAGWVLASGAAPSTDAAIQAIQQAPDPSAAVTAYANAYALDRNNPRLYDAYVGRMVDLGLPELAYHQAQTLTTLQSNNGLAWGVVAYVEARRAQMPEALSAVNLAGQYAPDNKFVQHTAGELAAWYDFKADKATVPQNTKDGLTSLRRLLEQRPAYTEAYTTAQKAYQSSASAPSQPSSAAPATGAPASATPSAVAPTPTVPNAPEVPMAPQAQADQTSPYVYSYSTPPPVPSYYPDYSSVYYSSPGYGASYIGWGPDYYYGYGPGWVSPSPWWWWQPCGYWGGPFFYPFGFVFAFDCDNHHHDGHDGHHNGNGHHGNDPAQWHNGKGSQNHNSFFGAPAHPSDSVTHSAHAVAARYTSTPNHSAAGTSSRWWTGGTHSTVSRTPGTTAAVRSTQPSIVNRSPVTSSRTVGSTSIARTPQQGVVTRSPGSSFSSPGSSAVLRGSPQGFVNRSPAASAPVARPWTGNANPSRVAPAAPRTTWSVPSTRAPSYSAPRFAAPYQGYAGSMGSFRGNSGMRAAPPSSGGFRSGGAVGGGFRSGGGAMSGGGHGGGGHGGGGGHR